MSFRIDKYGRIPIPDDIRDALNLVTGQEVGFSIVPQTRLIIISPFGNHCRICGSSQALHPVHRHYICDDCLQLALEQADEVK